MNIPELLKQLTPQLLFYTFSYLLQKIYIIVDQVR
jgi:hypothetical protein